MAQTEMKLSDYSCSTSKEDLSYLNEKFRQLVMEKKSEQDLRRINMKDINNINNNNNRIPYFSEQYLPLTSTRNATIGQYENTGSTRLPSVSSPIMDAYEKECQTAPEKIKNIPTDRSTMETGAPVQEITKLNSDKQLMMRAKQILMSRDGSLTDSHGQYSEKASGTPRHRPCPKQRRKERNALRRSLPQNSFSTSRDFNRVSSPDIGEFEVYTMESALPKIDWDSIEAHLRATGEEEKLRSTDREEIRKKLAMGLDDELMLEKALKKPSLHSRLQNSKGMNLQICFMNETASDSESQCSDTESTQDKSDGVECNTPVEEVDFVSRRAHLQAEARCALAQAKEMARMQMQIEKRSLPKSPVSEIVKHSFAKIGFPFAGNRRRMSRQILTDMNVAQLQVIVNDFHGQIESLNEALVQLLLGRDDLHMEQDSMLVDIEDLTKHL